MCGVCVCVCVCVSAVDVCEIDPILLCVKQRVGHVCESMSYQCVYVCDHLLCHTYF